MSNFHGRLPRHAADRILDHRGDPSTEPVAGLIAAASAPAATDAGEDRAVAIFLEATRGAPVTAGAGASLLTRMTRKVAALPTAALVTSGLVLGGGGLALAASQGVVDVPFTGHDNRSDQAPPAPSASNPGLSRTPGSGATHAPGQGTTGATHTPSASPSPSLSGLCRAYQAGAVPRKATNPAFAALSRAAGGAAGVDTYCVDLIGPAARPTHPTRVASPTTPARPTQAATPKTPPKPTKALRAETPTVPPRPTQATN